MIRVALTGLGAAAEAIWVPALQSLRGVTLVAGADPDPGAVGRMARLAPTMSVHRDLGELLDDHQSVDWVVVATPPDTHAALAITALRRGRHVLCEKPFAPSLEAVDAILAAAASAGRVVAVNHEMTCMPMLAAPLARIRAGEDGPLRFAQVWQTVVDPPANGWRRRGETMREFGTHAVDLLVHAFGEIPESVQAAMPAPDGSRGDPVDLVTLFFSGGRAGHIVLDRLCQGEHKYLECRFDCSSASLRASMGGRANIRVGLEPRSRRPALRLDVAGGGQAWVERGTSRQVIARNPTSTLMQATRSHLQAVFDAVTQGLEPPASGRRARDIVRIVEAAYRSAETGARLSLSAVG